MDFNFEQYRREQRMRKVERALEALPKTTPGDWWVDMNDELLNDPVGNFKLGRSIGGCAQLWAASNRAVIAASRELAEEVARLRLLVQHAWTMGPHEGPRWEESLTASMLRQGGCPACGAPLLTMQGLCEPCTSMANHPGMGGTAQ